MKTFYSVEVGTWGGSPKMEWYDNRQAAAAVAAKDYSGPVVVHRCSNPQTIRVNEARVAVTAGTATYEQTNLAAFGADM